MGSLIAANACITANDRTHASYDEPDMRVSNRKRSFASVRPEMS